MNRRMFLKVLFAGAVAWLAGGGKWLFAEGAQKVVYAQAGSFPGRIIGRSISEIAPASQLAG